MRYFKHQKHNYLRLFINDPCVCLFFKKYILQCFIVFPGGSNYKESACNVGDLCLIPGLGRSPAGGHATHSCVSAWRIPGTEEPHRLQSMGSQRVGHD